MHDIDTHMLVRLLDYIHKDTHTHAHIHIHTSLETKPLLF